MLQSYHGSLNGNPCTLYQDLDSKTKDDIKEALNEPSLYRYRVLCDFIVHLKQVVKNDSSLVMVNAGHVSRNQAIEENTYVPTNILKILRDWLSEKFVNDTLIALVEKGPLWDGDVPSKSERDALLEVGLIYKVICAGEEGFQAASYGAGVLYRHYFKARNIADGQSLRQLHRDFSTYYARDNHSYEKLVFDVEESLKLIKPNWDAGHIYGPLFSKNKLLQKLGEVRGGHDVEWSTFEKGVRDWFERAHALVNETTIEPG